MKNTVNLTDAERRLVVTALEYMAERLGCVGCDSVVHKAAGVHVRNELLRLLPKFRLAGAPK